MWGNNYFDEEENKWSQESETSNTGGIKRGFVKFIMEPICKLALSIAKDDKETY